MYISVFSKVNVIIFSFLLIVIHSLFGNVPVGKPYRFIENKGQWAKNINYRADIPGGVLFLENNCLTYQLFDNKVLRQMHDGKLTNLENAFLKFHAFKITFVNSFKAPKITNENSFDEYFNFFKGQDPSHWAANVKAYAKVNYENLYPGINLDIYSKNNHLKYDFVVAPFTDVKQIRMDYTGADKLALEKGSLSITTSLGTITERKPYCYQVIGGKLKVIECVFKIDKSTVYFDFPKGYDQSVQMTIDPELIFSTYSGSYADNFGYTATFDSEGFLFAAGSVFDVGYPVITGAFQMTYQGADSVQYNDGTFGTYGTDIGISKYDTTGKKLIYSTYLGGNGTELPHSIIVNSKDELYIYGTTGSRNFPVTNSALFKKFLGGDYSIFYGLGAIYSYGSDMFLCKLNQDGSGLLASTYIGGTENDGLNFVTGSLRYNYADEVRGEVDIDKDDNVYVVSCTQSPDFPIKGNAFQKTYRGGNLDGCILKFSSELDTLIWSSFLGGERSDAIYSVTIDSKNDLYVAGGTNSLSFPQSLNLVTGNTSGGRADGFIAHIAKDGTSNIKSVIMGSSGYDQLYFVELDKDNNVYVIGQTTAPGKTFIKNAKYFKENSGQFISKINPGLDSLIWSTAFGTGSGKPNISPTAFLVDLCNKIYVSGWGGAPESNDFLNDVTNPFNMDITSDAYQIEQPADENNFYLMVLADDASELVYGSFFGGNLSREHVDGGTSRFDRKGKIYESVCAGCEGNDDFPIKPDSAVSANNNSIRPPLGGCNNAVFKYDFKLPIVVADFKLQGCNPLQIINKSLTQQHTSFLWNFGDGTSSTERNPAHTYTSAGNFKMSLKLFDNFTCNLSDSIVKEVYISPLSLGISATANPTTILKNSSSQLQAFPVSGYSYSWTPANTLNNSKIPNPIASPKDTTTYTVTIVDPRNKCEYNASVTLNVFDIVCGEPTIYVPNAFTPNNDGKNEELFVRGDVLQELNFIIYDRWGEKVFETNDQKKGWNGYFRDMKADPGVFVYYLEATCINLEKFVKKGNITLIR